MKQANGLFTRINQQWNQPVDSTAERILLWVILTAALFLRLFHYAGFSYSNDELSALTRLNYNTFHDLVRYGFYTDGHPGGIQVFLWGWSKLFGISEASLRLPFVLMGVAAVYFAYRTGRYMFGPAAGLFSAASLAFLQFPLLYSQIARPYGSGMFFILLLVFSWLRVVFGREGEAVRKFYWQDHLLLILALALSMYNHYFSFLTAAIIGFSGLFFLKGKNFWVYVTDGMVACILFAPHLYITLHHLSIGGLDLWLGKPSPFWIFEHLYYILDHSVYTVLIFVFTLLLLWIFSEEHLKEKKIRVYRILLLTWFLLPFLIGYVYSMVFSPVLQHSVLIFSFPFFLLCIFSFSESISLPKFRVGILIAFLLAGTTGTVAINQYYDQQHFGEFRQVAKLTIDWNRSFGRNSITNVISVNHPNYIQYYLKKYGESDPVFKLYDIQGSEGLDSLSALVKSSRTSCYLFAWTKPVLEDCRDIIQGQYPFIKCYADFSGLSAIMLFDKDSGYLPSEIPGYRLLAKGALNKDAAERADSPFPDASGSIIILDSTTEYSKAVEIAINQNLDREKLVIFAQAGVVTDDPEKELLLVISVESEGKVIAWKGMPAKYFLEKGKPGKMVSSLKFDIRGKQKALVKIYLWNKGKTHAELKNIIYQLVSDRTEKLRRSGTYQIIHRN